VPRPPKDRRVEFLPDVTYFKPKGMPLRMLEEVSLTIEELEAIRLKDLEGLDQESCAKKMEVSRPTFQRVLMNARAKIADALVGGKAIKVEGGNYRIARIKCRCGSCDHEFEFSPVSGRRGMDVYCPECDSLDIIKVNNKTKGRHGHRRGQEF